MFTTVRHFARTWRRESAQTARVFEALEDPVLGLKGGEGARTLGELAWHIVTSPRVILGKLGLDVSAPGRDAPVPATVRELCELHRRAAAALEDAVASAWRDVDLSESVEFYGSRVPRGDALAVMLHHEIHHRGQLTALMRWAGLRVPGVYGPSGDEP